MVNGSGFRKVLRFSPSSGFNFGAGAGSANRTMADGDFLLESVSNDSQDLRLGFRPNRVDFGVENSGCGVDCLGDGADDKDEAEALDPKLNSNSEGFGLDESLALE